MVDDPTRAAKVAKPKTAEKVSVATGEAPEPDAPVLPGDDDFGPPVAAGAPEKAPELTEAERLEASRELPLPPPPPVPPTYLVRKGGRAWYRGQQIKFRDGEVFTSETWDELAVDGFRECGVTIERTA